MAVLESVVEDRDMVVVVLETVELVALVVVVALFVWVTVKVFEIVSGLLVTGSSVVKSKSGSEVVSSCPSSKGSIAIPVRILSCRCLEASFSSCRATRPFRKSFGTRAGPLHTNALCKMQSDTVHPCFESATQPTCVWFH